MNEMELNPHLRPPSEDRHMAMTELDLCGANNTTNIGENKSQNCSGQVICSDTECSLQEDERISRTRLSSTWLHWSLLGLYGNLLDSPDIGWEVADTLMREIRSKRIMMDMDSNIVRKANLIEKVITLQRELLKLDTFMSIERKETLVGEIITMNHEWLMLDLIMSIMRKASPMVEAYQQFQSMLLAFLAFMLFRAIVAKTVLNKQSLQKYSFVLAALFILWTSGDVEKHPGPSDLVWSSVCALLRRLVRDLQGTKTAKWEIVPDCWNPNIPFYDINQKSGSNTREKYAIFYAAIQATITKFGNIPNWCCEEMVFVETGNEAELQKCQAARKVRKVLKQFQEHDVDDILRRAGYQRQTGNPPLQTAASPTQPSSSTVVRHQRPQKCPYNVPGYRPITDITDAATAGLIAEGCMTQSKNAGNIRSNPSNKRQATTNAIAPAPKQQRLTTNQIPTATVSLSAQPGQSGTVSHTLAFIIPVPALTVTASPSGVSVPGVQTTSRRVPVTSTIVRPPATISTTSQVTLTSPPQSASVSMATGHQVTTMQTSNNNFTASSAVLPSPSTSGRQPLNLFPDGATSMTAMSTTSTTNLSSPLQPITMDTTQQGTMQQTSSDSSTISSTTPSGPLPSGRPRRGSLPSDDLQDLDLPPDFDIEEFAKQIMKDDKK